jgi:MFS transporter, ACS family, tartrate transporter
MQNKLAQPATSIGERTISKVTLRTIPFIFLLYIVAFLDRINISFASLTMNRELAIGSAQYGLLAGIFFLGYFLFEIPSNLLLHKIGARIWIARILITWGVLAALTGLANNLSQPYALRFALGVAEAGFAPGMLLYLTYWFPRKERARAVGLYLSGMPIATIMGAPLSGLILDHVHWAGLSSRILDPAITRAEDRALIDLPARA